MKRGLRQGITSRNTLDILVANEPASQRKHSRVPADVRIFIQNRIEYINQAVNAAVDDTSLLGEIATYALRAGGKRLRPALTLMLADSLAVPYAHVVPLLQAAELFHTSSLVFDDLPAQDDATLRRGKPTVHRAYTEWGAQLAGISMLCRGFGVLQELTYHFPAERVAAVTHYADTSLGFNGLCRGQAMDLGMTIDDPPSPDDLTEMYHYKTSVAIEAALVPLMLLLSRPDVETACLKTYAHHAGIAFQIRDDMLDTTALPEQLGKDVRQDAGKHTYVTLLGITKAEVALREHLQSALSALAPLPFDTTMLAAMARYLADRDT